MLLVNFALTSKLFFSPYFTNAEWNEVLEQSSEEDVDDNKKFDLKIISHDIQGHAFKLEKDLNENFLDLIIKTNKGFIPDHFSPPDFG